MRNEHTHHINAEPGIPTEQKAATRINNGVSRHCLQDENNSQLRDQIHNE